MKRLFTLVTCALVCIASWADSPLTSTKFSKAYEDHPMVQKALQIGEELPVEILNFLADANSPVDVRLAVVNAIGWDTDGKTASKQFEQFMLQRYGAKNEKELAGRLNAETLAVYAYEKAMSDYFNVKDAKRLAAQAAKKNVDKSFSVAMVDVLVRSQYYLDNNGIGKIGKTARNLVASKKYNRDMRQEAVDIIMEYLDLY